MKDLALKGLYMSLRNIYVKYLLLYIINFVNLIVFVS